MTNVDNMVDATKEEFDKFIEKYPNKLVSNLWLPGDAMHYIDTTSSKPWPESVVAYVSIYEHPYTYRISKDK